MNNSLKQLMKVWLLVAFFGLGFTGSALAATSHAVTASVTMETSLGTIDIELYGGAAPITVANFLEHVAGGYFDGAEFYRVVTFANDNGSPKIEVIQGGLNERISPLPAIAHETTQQTGVTHLDGVLSMARGEVGTASSEFFICIGDQPGLDFGQPRNADGQGFAAFGAVVSGMEVVRGINSVRSDEVSGEGYTAGQVLLKPVKIIRARTN
ncbi:MAG: peptidyl-prolyl cis-trans isomerase A (cyclophilin A) [Pseudohongiellaceae bacterium]|jgi:peptidyl-prolyl cis-trans isomerase A (cyclophilin A)